MSTINKQTSPKGTATLSKQRNYNEIIEFLDSHWLEKRSAKTLAIVKKLDMAFGSPSQKVNTILVGGTNGKGLTIHFTAKLLEEEGLKVGTFYSPHILTYNERININNETISNKTLTEIANEIITIAETSGLELDSAALLTLSALTHFARSNVDVAILEVSPDNSFSPVNICNTKIAAITRITAAPEAAGHANLQELIQDALGIIREGSWVVIADQSKMNLQTMQDITLQKKAHWAMPIRKLAPLPYPFEQLHGRCAALAERAAQLYVEHYVAPQATIISAKLLIKPKGNRGRPTLDKKREREKNPLRTLEQFWKEATSTLPGRFQLLDKEKPSILLDNASNLDALENLLLGIRLLHYRRQLKGLVLIMSCHEKAFETQEFLKLIRYFFRKTSGQILLCPVKKRITGQTQTGSWDIEAITNELKNLKIKAKATSSFAEAFEIARQSVDERYGLVVVAGSQDIIAEYWTHKDIKKL